MTLSPAVTTPRLCTVPCSLSSYLKYTRYALRLQPRRHCPDPVTICVSSRGTCSDLFPSSALSLGATGCCPPAGWLIHARPSLPFSLVMTRALNPLRGCERRGQRGCLLGLCTPSSSASWGWVSLGWTAELTHLKWESVPSPPSSSPWAGRGAVEWEGSDPHQAAFSLKHTKQGRIFHYLISTGDR